MTESLWACESKKIVYVSFLIYNQYLVETGDTVFSIASEFFCFNKM